PLSLRRLSDQRRRRNGPSGGGRQPSDERPLLTGDLDSRAAQRVAQEIEGRAGTRRRRDVEALARASAATRRRLLCRLERHFTPQGEEIVSKGGVKDEDHSRRRYSSGLRRFAASKIMSAIVSSRLR